MGRNIIFLLNNNVVTKQSTEDTKKQENSLKIFYFLF